MLNHHKWRGEMLLKEMCLVRIFRTIPLCSLVLLFCVTILSTAEANNQIQQLENSRRATIQRINTIYNGRISWMSEQKQEDLDLASNQGWGVNRGELSRQIERINRLWDQMINGARQRQQNLLTWTNARYDRLIEEERRKYAQQPPLDIGSTWRVVESCPDRKWIATWKLRPGTKTFDGTWKQVSGPGSGIPFSDVIDFKSSVNRQVSLYRRSLNGTYTGKLTPDGAKIKGGSASWYYSGCYWTAEISK